MFLIATEMPYIALVDKFLNVFVSSVVENVPMVDNTAHSTSFDNSVTSEHKNI